MLNLGEEAEVEALGRTYKFGRVTVAVIRAFRDYCSAQYGDPFALADRYVDKLPAEQALKLVKDAELVRDQLSGFSMSCPLAQKYLQTEHGMATLGQLLLKANHPQITLDEALDVMKALGGQIAEVLNKTQGEISPN